ncbi:histidine kinase [Cellulomonas sp. DKR-3]|uniref:Histidine kinase n=1 Tax=Cellulomonas fulva TaxID=2835530 RepID=A0ABS5TY64_9CELL|nr:histidine kinase [Cellulomonas fulva]MBT0994066.1 histidine kinase [Cellulomonas fulva]
MPSTPDQPAGPEQEPVPTPVPSPEQVSEPAVPSEAELERVAAPARVRRAPKFSVFIGAGAVVGAVVALLLALLLGGSDDDADASSVPTGTGFISFLDGQGAVNTVLGVTGAVVGGFVGGGLAVLADRRSRDPLR